ncbi:C40 family peptidase [Duncaniella freteri]|uniref:C40 family peptidase n=1 Tax=Duncaniella freteri TaxID=2530391 RepID=UPI002557ECF3|nr:C40 family peptidase [Duncaniella freteri]
MNRYVITIITFILALLGIASVNAAPTLSNYPVPAKHFKSVVDTSEELVKSAFKSARENSPFAAIEAEISKSQDEEHSELVDQMKEFAAKYLGTRYRLGATGPNQFDCSGFIGYVFRNFGFNLNRDSRSQYLQGEHIDKGEIKPGDLLFFSSRSSGKGSVGDVAMVVDVNNDGSCRFIHASSSKRGVVYQNFPDNGYYSRHFIGAKRIIGTSI